MAEEEEEWDGEYEDEYEDGEFEDEADGDFEDDNEADPDFADADFGDDDGFEDGGDGWGDDGDVDLNADQEYIPIQVNKPTESDEEVFELDKDGNIISPIAGNLKRQKSIDNQCWKCSNCGAVNKLTWTLSKFAMKCCICKQDTYTPTVDIFNSDEWDEPSNDYWECPRCTLHNTIGTNECQACQQSNEQYIKESDDDYNGDGLYQKGEDSSDPEDDNPMMGGMGGMHHMGGRMGGGGRFGGPAMGGMGPMGGMLGGLFGAMAGPRMGMGRRRKKPRDTRPFNKKKEANLRNLLIVGFIRKCDVPQLPTKFFDYFNFYYLQFDRWDWDFFRSNWTTKRDDLITIKRGKKDNGRWRNMFGLKHIKMNPKKQKFPYKFSWTLRILDRKQMESVRKTQHDEDDESADDEQMGNGDTKKQDEEEEKKRKEKYELQYMDVIVGVVNVEKLGNQGMAKAFNQYSCGYGLFAGNGKVCKSPNDESIRVFKPIKHGESLSVNLEWMTKGQYKKLYATPKELEEDKKKGADKHYDDFCVALTFTKGQKKNMSYPKGGAFMLPWSSPYKLAVASAKKRWEIEWISSNWCSQIDTELKGKDDNSNNVQDDDNKDEIN